MTLDTLKTAERLIGSGLNKTSAEEISRILGEMEEQRTSLRPLWVLSIFNLILVVAMLGLQ